MAKKTEQCSLIIKDKEVLQQQSELLSQTCEALLWICIRTGKDELVVSVGDDPAGDPQAAI